MKIDEYQKAAHSTSLNTDIHGDKVIYSVISFANEAGEVTGKFKKLFRDKNSEYDNEFKEVIVKELGDAFWYLAEICTQLDISLDHVASTNLAKLSKRQAKNKIKGDGDDR